MSKLLTTLIAGLFAVSAFAAEGPLPVAHETMPVVAAGASAAAHAKKPTKKHAKKAAKKHAKAKKSAAAVAQ